MGCSRYFFSKICYSYIVRSLAVTKNQFLLEHKAPIKALKKRAFKKAAWVFVGITSLFIFIFGSAFWILLLFPIVAAFITYARLSQLYLYQQFPEHFGPPKTPGSRKSRFLNSTHPLNPISIRLRFKRLIRNQ